MEKARYNTELYSNLRAPRNNVKPSNFWGSHHTLVSPISVYGQRTIPTLLLQMALVRGRSIHGSPAEPLQGYGL